VGGGGWRFVGVGAICVYLFISVVLPVLVLLWTSLTPRIIQPGLNALSSVSWANWARIPGNKELNHVLLNTVIAVVLAATFTVGAALVVSWISQRTAFRARRLLDQLSFASHGLPGVILGLAMIWFWVRLDLPVYGTMAIIVIGLCTGFLAYGSRTIGAALLQLHRELEEAAYTSGAAPQTAVRRVVTPLLMPALISLWLWAALQALRLVTLPLMLQTGPENTVLAVYLWNNWNKGELNLVAAVGTAMVGVMFMVTLIVSRFGLLSRRSTLI
jgi:iron(III) transport system permease protein